MNPISCGKNRALPEDLHVSHQAEPPPHQPWLERRGLPIFAEALTENSLGLREEV